MGRDIARLASWTTRENEAKWKNVSIIQNEKQKNLKFKGDNSYPPKKKLGGRV